MTVHVEFLGIPRTYADCAEIEIEAATLGESFGAVAVRLPRLAEKCFTGDALRSGYLAAVNGRVFTSHSGYELRPGDRVQILSADVGG